MRGVGFCMAVATALAALPSAAHAQFPAELAGRVIEQGTSRPIDGALVEIEGAAHAITDAGGAFTLRVADPGVVTVVVTRPGYSPLRTRATLESGRTSVVVLSLVPAPILIDALEVVAQRESGVLLTRTDIEESGVHTLGELLRGVPGVVVVRAAGGGGERISIRGGAPDEVLVLVDGVPANDPLTGEADAGAINLQGVQSVRVLPGARSARHGARAATGVVLVETASRRQPYSTFTFGGGSLEPVGSPGSMVLEAEAGGPLGPATASGGIRYHEADGEFEYELPDALGGGTATRQNGGERELGGFAAVARPLAGGPLRLRIDGARIERGLPGPMRAPTPQARQNLRRMSATMTWHGSLLGASLAASANAGWHRLRYRDPAPSFGPAYDDTTDVREAGARIEIERVAGDRLERTIAVGAEARAIRLESSSLEPSRVARTDPSAFARASLDWPYTVMAPGLSIALRADRWNGDWIASHEIAARASLGPLTASIAHRSAFSPPAASDQFFGAGFAIAPNAALEPERIPSELEAGVTAAFDVADVPVEIGANAFQGDIEGMIVWAPDFRFIWSPRNRDVKRSGGEAWLRVRPAAGIELSAWASRARVTYDWPGDADTVQVVYRPRHSGRIGIDWRPAAWRLDADAIYTGLRYATPGQANPLAGYWNLRLAVAREWRHGPLSIDTALRIDRLLDNTDTFVHGYAEPGRRISLEVRISVASESIAHAHTNDPT